MMPRSCPGTYMHPALNTGKVMKPEFPVEVYERFLEGLRLLRTVAPPITPEEMPVQIGNFNWFRADDA